jgi:hypothetical protein
VLYKENYGNKLSFFSSGCEPIQRVATNEIPYSQNRMINFFTALNACLFPGSHSEVIYKKPPQKIVPYVFAGGLPLGDQYEATVQFVLRFYAPSISRLTSFNTGLYGYFNSRNQDGIYVGQTTQLVTNYVSVPAIIQQNFTSGVVQPYIYVGAALQYIKQSGTDYNPQRVFQKDFNVGIIAGGGIEAFFGKLLVKADWRYELFSHFPTIGVGYRLK